MSCEPRYRSTGLGPVPTQVTLFIAKARYILGEDIGYQISYSSPHVALQPCGGHTAREMLARLVLGAYDEVLREAGLL